MKFSSKNQDKPSDQLAGHEAAKWVARLDRGELTTKTLLEFRAWLEADPQNLTQMNRYTSLWDDLDSLRLYRTVIAIPRASRWQSRSGLAAIAASLAVFVFTITLLWFSSNNDLRNYDDGQVITNVGQIKNLPLSDGSRIDLNTDSSIEIHFSPNTRRVTLAEGEAFFNVNSQPNRPFVVETPLGNVTAIGTAFLVRLNGDSVKITVQSGRVQVAHGTGLSKSSEKDFLLDSDGSDIIDAGQSAIVELNRVTKETLDPSSLFRQLAWREGMLVFEAEPLDRVLAEFNRYAQTKIVIADPALRELKLGGYFPVGDVDSLLKSLDQSFDIMVVHTAEDQIALYTTNSSAVSE